MCRNACMPDCASTRSCPKMSSAASSEMRFSGVSSTKSILARSGARCSGFAGLAFATELPIIALRPRCDHLAGLMLIAFHAYPENGEQLLQVDWLRDVVRCSCFQAL